MHADGVAREIQFRVLGPVEVRRDDEVVNLGGAQQRRLLAALLTESGTVVPLDRMVDVVWADGDAPEGARRSLMTYVSRLRASLGDGYVTTQEPGYLLDPGAGSLDAERFERLVDQARSSAPTESIALLDQALALWHGPAFGEFGAEWWARPEAVRLDELRLVAAEERAEAQLSSRQHERAVSDLEALVAAYPLRERLVGQLMRALNASGRQAEALRAFSTFRAYLAEETGLDPSETLIALDREIASGTPTPATDGQLSVRGYVLGESLGEGAFGSVYRAVQPGVGREVAVKVIRAEFADDPVFVQRFEAEAQLVARLEHPHIVPLYDFWREPGGAFLVFRLLRGGTAERSLVVDGPWTLDRVTQLVDEVGGALMAAHAAGVVHRDVKPANVLFDEAGSSYLADFGISVTEGLHGLAAGFSAGSPIYAGPEQFHGDAATPENDVYGLAITVWELLAGLPPFDGASAAEILRSKMTEPVGSLRSARPDVPAAVEAVLQRATAVQPKDRYPNAAEFVLAWQSAVGRAGATGTTGMRANVPAVTPRAEAARTMAHLQAGLTNPYKGLRPFGEADARDFHGRADLVDELTAMAGAARFIAVVGPSGSGKSSLVHAGVVPRLRASGCRVVTMVPAAAPLGQLRTALLAVATRPVPYGDVTEMAGLVADDDGGDLVLVVDQFEEAWTLAEPGEREQFLDGLAAVAAGQSGVRVVVTIRADFFDRPLAHPALGPLVSAHTFSVTPMTSAELLDAIQLPALALGVTFEAGLDTQLVAEVVSQPASLPLLQFALAELYDQRTGSTVTAASYGKMGGVAGAIAARAEQVYGELDREQRQATRRLFARLVTPGDEAADTRRRARRSELPDAVLEVVDQLGAHRLLTFDHDPVTREPTVEVAHESLLRSWPRLQRWIDDDRDWLRQLGHLSGAAVSWDERGRETADLYAGTRLASATEALDARGDSLSPLEHEFVTVSADHAAATERHDRLARHRLQRLLLVTAVLLVLALIGAALAFTQTHSADRQRAAADEARSSAQVEALANRSTALRGTQRDVAALLAVEAHRLQPDDNSNGALLSALTQSPGFLGYTRVPDAILNTSGTVLAGGTTAMILTDTGQLMRIDLTTGRIDRPYPSLPLGRLDWSFLRSSNDGRLVALVTTAAAPSSTFVATVRILDATSGALVSGPIDFDFPVGDMALSPDDSTLIVSGGKTGEVDVVTTADGQVRGRIAGLPKPAESTLESNTAPLAVRSDGLVYVGSEAGPIRVVDPTSMSVVSTIDAPQGTAVDVLRLAPDERSLLAVGSGRTSRIDLPSGQIRWQIGDQAGDQCQAVTIAGPTNRFYCGDIFGRLGERDYETGAPTGRDLDAQQGNTGELSMADGGHMLVAFGANAPVVDRWRLDGAGLINTVVAPGAAMVGYTAEGTSILAGNPGTNYPGPPIRLIDPTTGTLQRSFDRLLAAIPSTIPNRVLGVTTNADGLLGLSFDATTGEVAPEYQGGHLDVVPDVATVDPQGRMLFLADHTTPTGETLQIDAHTGVRSPTVIPASGNSASLSEDGRRLVISGGSGTTAYDPTSGALLPETLPDVTNSTIAGHTLIGNTFAGAINLYDVDTFQQIGTLPGSRGFANQLLVSADGHTLVVRGGDRTVSLYDLTARERIGQPIVIGPEDANYASLRPDGQAMAVGGGSRGIQIWDLDPDHWAAAACQLAGRNLTQEEWTTYLSWAGPYHATCSGYDSGS